MLDLSLYPLALLLSIGTGVAPASAQCADDALEPNNDCSTLALLNPGAYQNLTVDSDDGDAYRVALPAGNRIQVDMHLVNPAPDTGGFLTLFLEDGSPDPCVGFGNSVGSEWFSAFDADISLAWSASSAAAEEILISLEVFDDGCLDYEMTIAVFPDPCEETPDGGIQGNDTCATAAQLTPGLWSGQRASQADRDFYEVTAQPGELLTVIVTPLSGSNSFSLFAYDQAAGCDSSLVGSGIGYSGSEGGMYLHNTEATPATYVFEVIPQSGSEAPCMEYDLELLTNSAPCDAWLQDVTESNGSCMTAAVLTGPASDLGMRALESDWYSIMVPSKSTVRVTATPTSSNESRSMHLNAGCNNFVASSVNLYYYLLGVFDPRTYLEWSNLAATPQETRLQLWRTARYPAPYCVSYDLDVSFTLGEPFCLATLNSSGEGARITASGSTTVGQGTLDLTVDNAPATTVGLIFFGPGAEAVSIFGSGYLCVSGPFLRLPVASTGGSGAWTTTIDWSGSDSSALISAGDNWYFQGYFREPSSSTGFNVTEGLRLSFQ